jgi:putative component of toxin-antitoxin plasmid stabilization module
VSKEGNQRNKEWFDEYAKSISEKNARKRILQRETSINCGRY